MYPWMWAFKVREIEANVVDSGFCSQWGGDSKRGQLRDSCGTDPSIVLANFIVNSLDGQRVMGKDGEKGCAEHVVR